MDLVAANDMPAQRGRLEEAGVYYREALEKRRQVLGDNHPDTLVSLNFLGQLCVARGKLDDAAIYWREALDKRRRALGDNHPQTLNSLSSMADLLRRQGRSDEAEPMLREVVDKRRWVLGPNHPLTLDAIVKYADIREALGRWEAVETLRREAVELFAKHGKPADRDWIAARISHARALVGLKRHQAAERELLDAYESIKGLGSDQIDIRRRCAEALQHVYEDWATLEPGKGHDAKIAQWRNVVHELQP